MSKIQEVTKRYAVAVTTAVRGTFNGEPDDPVARQYLPDEAELVTTPDELADPIGDEAHAPVKGIVHRYPDRVLLKPVHVCAVYCRFCFRREKVGPGQERLSDEELSAALDYIRGNAQIWEVIITGGDPFVLSPRRLSNLMRALEEIEHVKIIRFHTRVPIADPARVTPELMEALKSSKAVYVALHCNHANEITDQVRAAVKRLRSADIALVSQSVLLRGVNDDAAVLEKLFRTLTEMKVKPYYLHHPDRAPGTSHFRLSIEKGRAIMRVLHAKLSGIARPSYVLDIPGGFGKVPAGEAWIEDGKATDIHGQQHVYGETDA